MSLDCWRKREHPEKTHCINMLSQSQYSTHRNHEVRCLNPPQFHNSGRIASSADKVTFRVSVVSLTFFVVPVYNLRLAAIQSSEQLFICHRGRTEGLHNMSKLRWWSSSWNFFFSCCLALIMICHSTRSISTL